MTTQSERKSEKIGLWFWIRWVVASGLGMLIGFTATFLLIGLAIDNLLGERADSVMREEGPAFFIALAIVFTVAGASMGFMQWLVLRPHVTNGARWPLASGAGFALVGLIYWALSGVTSEVVNEIVHNAIGGAVAGTIQWSILRNEVARAAWWIPTSSAVFIVAGGVNAVMGDAPLSEVVGIIAMASISGAVLVWLLSNSAAKEPQAA